MAAFIRLFHVIVFTIITLASIISLAISASLVSFYNKNGYPDVSIRDRTRIFTGRRVSALYTPLTASKCV